MTRIATTFALCFAITAHADTLIHAGFLINGVDDKPKSEMTIVIADGEITAVEEGYRTAGAGDEVIDLKGHTVMPGLMDMHTHLTFENSRASYTERYTLNPGDYAYRSVKFAERTLMAGFTTVRDLGSAAQLDTSLRDAIARGDIVGPRIFACSKSIATTGGHADPTNGLRRDLREDAGPAEGVINGPDDARKAVRKRYQDGADVIKITATGGVLSLAASGQNPQFTEEELKAIVETAHDYGMKVAVHAHGEEGMRRAVEAGVDSIEHGTYMSVKVMRLMKKRGTYYVPTILAGHTVAERAKEAGYYPAIIQPKAATIGPLIQNTFARAYTAGVKIAFGTDSGVSRHGDNAKEFGLMVDAGMPAMEAIQSATMATADLLGVEDKLGSIEQGKIADIVATPGNPLQDITAMERIDFVMKQGQTYRTPE